MPMHLCALRKMRSREVREWSTISCNYIILYKRPIFTSHWPIPDLTRRYRHRASRNIQWPPSMATTAQSLLRWNAIGLFSDTISISSQMTQCRIILLLQPITKLYLFTIKLKLRDYFRCFCSKMCFRTFSTVPLNSPTAMLVVRCPWRTECTRTCRSITQSELDERALRGNSASCPRALVRVSPSVACEWNDVGGIATEKRRAI